MYFLYRILFPNGCAYIGVTVRPSIRLREHRRTKSFVGRAVRRHGTSVKLQVLACGGRSYIYAIEQTAIQAFRTRWPHGYNLAAGGSGGRDPLPSTRRKLAAAVAGHWNGSANPNFGGISPEHREKLAAAKIGTKRGPHTSETIAKMSAAKKGNTARLGKPHSEETKRKISATKQASKRFSATKQASKRFSQPVSTFQD